MNAGLIAQYVMNGLMLGMMYALVAVGFTLFFGVLDVIKFSHGDVLTVGAFTALATFVGLRGLGVEAAWLQLAVMVALATLAMALLGMLIARTLVMPAAHRARAQHAADHADARHRAARISAAVLPAGRQSEAVSVPASCRRRRPRRLQSAAR
jgi:hypothetical protein